MGGVEGGNIVYEDDSSDSEDEEDEEFSGVGLKWLLSSTLE